MSNIQFGKLNVVNYILVVQLIHKMNTFSYIIHKINSVNSDLYDFDLSNLSINNRSKYMTQDINNAIKQSGSHSRCHIVHHLIFHIRSKIHIPPDSHLNKFEYFNMLTHMKSLSADVKLYATDIYIRGQKHYNALCRFAYLFKLKRSPVRIDTDLYLNKLNASHPNVITIFQNKQRYLFNITDLNKMIETALCNSPYFISEPLPVKNPYNNLPFSKSELYNIYFQISDKLIRTPDVIYEFFRSNFNMTTFQRDNLCLIREKYINRFIDNEEPATLVDYINDMLSHNMKIKVDIEFPDSDLIRIFKPYLRLYLNWKYSLDISVKNRSKYILINKLNRFHRYNPQFGRQITKIKNKKVDSVTYVMDHIDFGSTRDQVSSFLTSHTTLTTNYDDHHELYSSSNSEDNEDDNVENELQTLNDDDDDTIVEDTLTENIDNPNETTETTTRLHIDLPSETDNDYDFRMLVSEIRMNTNNPNATNPNATINELIDILVTQHRQRINNMNNLSNNNTQLEPYISDTEFEELNEDLYDP